MRLEIDEGVVHPKPFSLAANRRSFWKLPDHLLLRIALWASDSNHLVEMLMDDGLRMNRELVSPVINLARKLSRIESEAVSDRSKITD